MNIEAEIFKPEDMQRIIAMARKSIGLALKYMATDVWGNIRRFAPTDQGRLAGSFTLEHMDELAYRISSNVHYAMFVHEGTGIYGPKRHPIVPVNAKALKFFWKKTGRVMIFKGDLQGGAEKARFRGWAGQRGMTPVLAWVKGMKGRPYATQAIDKSRGRAAEFIDMALKETAGGTN